MAIYVDDMAIHGWGKNVKSCHLLAIPPDDPELHNLAAKIGLRRSWFQGNASWPHYDLKGGMRQRAISAGVTAIDSKELAVMRINYRNNYAAHLAAEGKESND